MSLRAFHMVFISACVLLWCGFAAWCFARYKDDGGIGYGLSGAVSVLAVGGLGVYARYFFRKMKDLNSP